VRSGVITCIRKENAPDLDFDGFRLFVKAAFNQRRKTTRNALKLLGKNLSQFNDARLDSARRTAFRRIVSIVLSGLEAASIRLISRHARAR
jgi:16S rRNA A1518/A1519 N6-dimethyltransferase RsmA/KsgA/DIM1 with predicted DNA glycosylase/AP lyase activity